VRFCYADPPYLGRGKAMYGFPEWDKIERHHELVLQLRADFPDGWAMSCSSSSLLAIGYACPNARVAAWCKPWSSFKPNVSPQYSWEPVIFAGGRKATRQEWSGRDFIVTGITHRRSVRGAKPEAFCLWLFEDIFHAQPDDEFVDMFPGSGAVTRAWEEWRAMRGPMQSAAFKEGL
jgi:hypothetical protein